MMRAACLLIAGLVTCSPATAVASGAASLSARGAESVFSGPQPGETLPPFRVLAVNGPDAGKEVDYITRYGDAPILLIFAHYIDRNVYRVMWPCDRYAAERASAGLRTLYVYLAPEKVAGERRMAQVVKSLSLEVPAAVSLDGDEGPGAYGLNKQVGVTAIVAKGRKVVANFAIVQPGLTDSPKIIAEVVKLVGGKVPTAEELNRGPAPRMPQPDMKPPGQAMGRDAADGEAPDFLTRVQPKLVKAGCFSGACHGAGAGKGGFKLSLLGYDPEVDYDAIVYQFRGRRINLVRPEESLVLRKPTMQQVHLGGERFAKGSETYRTLVEWIRAGAPYEGRRARAITGLEISPEVVQLQSAGARGQLKVTATFSDGSRDDVTAYALFTSNDEAIARVSPEGEFTVQAPGETGVSARYMGLFRTARVGMPFAGNPADIARTLGKPQSFIDRLIADNLLRLRLVPSPLCSDAEFLRRAHLDVLGALPTVDEARAFAADTRPDKRARLVEALLERPQFGDYWSLWLLDLFRVRGKSVGDRNAELFARWLKEQLRADTSLGDIARDVVTAVGDGTKLAPVNYLRQSNDPKLLSELTTEALMGSSSRCAQCHNPPFDSWTQTQYHQMVAFFVRVDRTDTGTALADHGEIEHPKTGKPVSPGFPDGAKPGVLEPDRRNALAEWLVSPQNPYFARSFANRVWARLMGRGIIVPVDNLTVSNAPSNPELLQALADSVRGAAEDHPGRAYSLKGLIRTIVTSQAYQRSSQSNAVNGLDDRFYSRALARPLGPYVYADAIASVTGVPETFGKLPAGTRAVEVSDPGVESYLLDVCGRCQRDGSCDAPNPAAGGVRQALHLINGPALNAKIGAPAGRLAGMRARTATPSEIAEEFYLAALARPPTAEERAYWQDRIGHAADPNAATEDLIWALLNSRAFVFDR
jgi:hypothetical protein